MTLIQRIDALLPQTQCGKCGHAGCKPYAVGIAAGEPINRCPPGGDATIAALAKLLQLPVLPLDPERGAAPAQIAYIREAECIGCTKCIQACPVDAILGAAKLMHSVLADECTGCDLCVAPCPVDCIEMHPAPTSPFTSLAGDPSCSPEQQRARLRKRDHARQRFEARNRRLQRLETARQATRSPTPARSSTVALPVPPALSAIERIKAAKAAKASDGDTALKQAKIAVAMTRAQLVKTRKAFVTPPTFEHYLILDALGREHEAAERHLAALQTV
ncbi:RnfABCDGE type electron transport complex subunit B [Pseudomonas sp. CFBP 8770]|nr:RnfABCDGE type electron transport complex subunit B [Pseudomonas sp. CFBP 8773]MBD8645503.1 RnfABCDGE type electron transport complex subunit B [Pseudomonas sp. CFBP 8770]